MGVRERIARLVIMVGVPALVASCTPGQDASPRTLRDRQALSEIWGVDKNVVVEGHQPILPDDRARAAASEAPSVAPDTGADAAQVRPVAVSDPKATLKTATSSGGLAVQSAMRPMSPRIRKGTDRLVGQPSASLSASGASASGVEDQGETVSLNFRDVDIKDVVAGILGETLGENFIIDPGVEGRVTLQTGRPIPRDQLLETLDQALRSNDATLVRQGAFYEVRRLSASGVGTFAPIAVGRTSDGETGFSTQIVPLTHVGARAVKEAVAPLVPENVTLDIDPARNVVMVSGSAGERARVLDLIKTFDADWMAGMSFALLPLEAASASAVTTELRMVFGAEGEGLAADLVEFVPIDRLNAVLVMAKSAAYVDRVRGWVETFDRGGQDDGRRIYVYQVKNGQAKDIAVILGGLFDATQQSLEVSETAPGQGAQVARSQPAGGLGGAAGAAGAGGAGAGGQGGANPFTRRIETNRAQRDKLIISNDRIRIIADEQQNSLVILARPADYQQISSALVQLDAAPTQVLIEATIAEVALTDELRFGIQWFLETGKFSAEFSSAQLGGVASTFPGFNVLFQGTDARVVLDALDGITDVQVVSSPQLMVLNNETAVLQVGDQVPVATRTSVSVVDPDAPQVNSLEYRDTGVILSVTPHVNSRELVMLDVEQEVSDVVETTTSGIDSPTIQQRRVLSRVAAKSGQTVALGGLIRETASDRRNGIPGVSRIPVVGRIFGNTNRLRQRTELLVLITPHVLEDAVDIDAATEELKSRLTAMRVMLGQ